MARSLYRRIYLHFLALLVGVGALSSWTFFGSWPGNVMTDMATRVTIYVAAQLSSTPAQGRRGRVVQLGDDLDLDLSLYDRRGNLLAQRGHALPPVKALETFERTGVMKQGTTWFVATPVRAGDEALVLECVPTALTLRAMPLQKLVSFIGLLVLVSLAVRPLARRISRPVELLIDASRRFGRGDLSTRVPLPRIGPHRHHRHRPNWHQHWHHMHDRWHRHRFRYGDELYALMHAWNDMAERIERQVGQQRELLANVSHELRSPLARVRVALALLPDDDKTRQRISDIEADLAELDQLIGAILETSRLEAVGLPTQEKTFEASALFDEVLARAKADPLTAPLQVSIDRDAPPSGELHGDCALLRRALFNLIENAAKYAAPPVTLGFETHGPDVHLIVTDTGPGVPASERANVLRPFIRGDKAHTPGRGGVGLGLSFAARVAEVHGGELTLGDSPRGGLRVTIRIPKVPLIVGTGQRTG